MALAVVTLAVTVSQAISGGIAAANNGGDSKEIWSGIGKGALNGFVLGGSISLAIGGFAIGATTLIGSMMITYGISVACNMCEVSWVQAKKSISDGDSLTAMRNDINNAVFANLGRVLTGRFGDQAFGFYGIRLFSKLLNVSNFFDKVYETSQFYKYSFAFIQVGKSFWKDPANPASLAFGYIMTTIQIGSLWANILGEPNFDSGKWILY